MRPTRGARIDPDLQPRARRRELDLDPRVRPAGLERPTRDGMEGGAQLRVAESEDAMREVNGLS